MVDLPLSPSFWDYANKYDEQQAGGPERSLAVRRKNGVFTAAWEVGALGEKDFRGVRASSPDLKRALDRLEQTIKERVGGR